MYRCIYCGTEIPAGVGLRCAKCSNSAPTHKQYDSEFSYDRATENKLPDVLREMESLPKARITGSDAVDKYYELKESNTENRKKFRWENQDEFKLQRTGRILHMNEFLRLLRCAGVNAWYNNKGGMPGTLGLNACRDDKPQYICFVQVPFMQEFEEMYFDQYDVPLGSKRRGWRTVLLRLIDKGFLNEQIAHEFFGEPSSGPVSRRYRQVLQLYRNRNV